MKEMNKSLALNTSGNMTKKSKKDQFKYGSSAVRGFSNPSSRPRSQLGAT